MSIEKRGKSWRVRWLQEGEHRSRTFSDYREAKGFDLKMQSLKLEGRLRSAPRITLSEFAERRWFPKYVQKRLAEATQRNYRRAWDTHVAPREPTANGDEAKPPVRADSLGARRLRDLTNATVRELHLRP